MPWNMKDYPPAMKNLEELTRKKAIDIGNALLAEGYPDDRAIRLLSNKPKNGQKMLLLLKKKSFLKKKIQQSMILTTQIQEPLNY